ncbi:MAG: CPBP family intramembrane metalloprotease [Acidobacteriota bacterium]|nr:CPBP family intramembrane metalloprotease [Acidobacteriota bacterium]
MKENGAAEPAPPGKHRLSSHLSAAEWVPAAAAALLFIPLFTRRGFGPLDFWWAMSAAIIFLVGLAAAFDRGYLPALARDLSSGAACKIALGLIAAAALYGVFWTGNEASRLLFPFAASDIGSVYGFKSGVPIVRVVLLMTLLIGPGEEIFWRAYLQRRWQARFGPWSGFLAAAALYALVHLASGNVMLVLAAGVCGLFWGFLYLKTGSVLLVAVSHTAWDLAVFILWPFH